MNKHRLPKNRVTSFTVVDEDEEEEQEPQDKETGVSEYRDYTKTFTPLRIGMQMMELLELTETCTVLEPSAGVGNLIFPVQRKMPNLWVDYYELNENNNIQLFLSFDRVVSRGTDFLGYNTPLYDRIIANPPMDEDKWMSHIIKMIQCLAPGGVLVTIAPRKPIIEADSLEWHTFKLRMKELGAESIPIENWHSSGIPIHIIKTKRK